MINKSKMKPRLDITVVHDEFQGRPFTYYEVSSHDDTVTTESFERAQEIAEEMREKMIDENNNSC